MARKSKDEDEKPKRKKKEEKEEPKKRGKKVVEEEKPKRKKKGEEEPKKKRAKKGEEEEKPKRGKKAKEEEEPKKKRAKKGEEEEKPKRGKKAKEEEEKPKKRGKKSKDEEDEKPKKRKKKSDDDDEVVDRKSSKDLKAEAREKVFNPYGNGVDLIDSIERKVGVSDNSLNKNETRMSTNVLMQDLCLGGGITAGWYTNFGAEQSCKTTNAVTMLAGALKSEVPFIFYYDYEGSASPDYIENIFRKAGLSESVENIFGVKDPKTGHWTVPPRVRYRSESVAEKFFDFLASLERKLPDKVLVGEQWYFVYEDTKDNRKIVGDSYEEKYFRKTGKLRVPAPDGKLQAVVLVDSYPAMLPEVQDVDDPNSAIAVQARMFSDQLKRVKGRMRGKRIAVLGINQLRKVPMAMYGPSEAEPGGEALKLYSDVRLKHTSRSLSGAPEAWTKKGQVEEERSVLHKGNDEYRYVHVRAHKNKLSRPYIEFWLRMWIKDPKGNAHGFCPVFDCVSGDSLVSTNKGLLRIDEIPNYATAEKKGSYYSISGLKALGGDGKMHRITAWGKKGIKQLYEIELHHGHKLKVTDNHKIKVLTSSGNLEWKKVADLNLSSDYAIIAKGMPFSNRHVIATKTYERIKSGHGNNQYEDVLPKKVELNEDWGYLMGYLTSDGWFGESKHQLRLFTSSKKSLKNLIEVCSRILGKPPSVHKYEPTGYGKKSAWFVCINSREVEDVLEQFGVARGVKSPEKTVPKAIWTSTKEVVASFLRGLYAGDGSIGKGDFSIYSSYSSKLKEEVSLLLWQFGITNRYTDCTGYSARDFKTMIGICSAKKLMPKTGKLKVTGVSKSWDEKLPMENGYGYNLTVRNLFAEKPVMSLQVRSNLEGFRNTVSEIVDAGFRPCRIKSITPIGKEQTYDITVEKTHDFVANGILIHNCYEYLKATGQVLGKRSKLKLKIHRGKSEDYHANSFMTWADFKLLILGKKSDMKSICEDIGIKPLNLREYCFKQIATGVGIELFNQHTVDELEAKAEKASKKVSSSEDSDDEEDDND